MNLDDEIEAARASIHEQIDASAEKAMRVIHSMCERDRRSVGQRTRFDHFIRRFNRRH